MQLEFLGAAGEVTGSCFRLALGGRQILVDCGLIQGSRQDERRNAEPFPFDAAAISAVILTHAHLDHCGRLPLLVRAGFRGRIYAHQATRDLCRILLKDAAHLNLRDSEWENRRRARKHLPPIAPLYTLDEVLRTLRLFTVLDYEEQAEAAPGMAFRLHDAGHILGSAIVELTLSERGATRRLVFSGDLGHRGAPILRDMAYLSAADAVVMESTYGDRCHRGWAETDAEFEAILNAPGRPGGNVLIPAFSVGRSQDLLYLFARNYDRWRMSRWRIFLDSPMAIEATEVYLRHSGLYDEAAQNLVRGVPLRRLMAEVLPNLTFTRTPAQSMAINKLHAGAIIIAGSGMCNGGRIRHHLKHLAWRRETRIVMVGFQARGTLGRALVDGAKRVRLLGETVSVGARVHTIGGLSAHADQKDLLDWYGRFAGHPPVWLVHGEPEASAALAEAMRARFRAPVRIARRGELLRWPAGQLEPVL